MRCLPLRTIGSSYSYCLCRASGRPFTNEERADPVSDCNHKKKESIELSQQPSDFIHSKCSLFGPLTIETSLPFRLPHLNTKDIISLSLAIKTNLLHVVRPLFAGSDDGLISGHVTL